MLDDDTRDITKYIICGRGRCNYNCLGNIVFRQSVAKHVKSYMNFKTRTKKSRLILLVIEELRNIGMTFMVISDDGITLKELSPSEARKKVAHRFRDAVRESMTQVTKGLTKEKTTFPPEGKYHRKILQSFDNPSLKVQENAKQGQPLFLSNSLTRGEAHQSTQSTPSTTLNIKYCTNNEFLNVRTPEEHSQEMLLPSMYTENPIDDPEILLSLSSRNDSKSMSLQYEILKRPETILNDLIELINASPNTDYGEDYDDLSMLLTNCDDLLCMQF
jgi:hypothetical protein